MSAQKYGKLWRRQNFGLRFLREVLKSRKFAVIKTIHHNAMKHLRIFSTLLLAALPLALLAQGAGKVIDVTKQRVKGDGRTLCTAAINKVIAKAPEGAEIVFPAGRYLTGTIHLKSNMTLRLEAGAEIVGSLNIDDYDSYIPTKDMSRYDTGAGTRNANVTSDARWTKALILGVGLENVHIAGPGLIDGQHVEDSLGEESMRGPHGILLAECKDVSIKGVNITRASNYAILGYELERSEVVSTNITQGWDGVHIRGGKDVRIADCNIKTGDDAIAGGYWTNMVIEGCSLNSSCNGLRIIEPSDGVTVEGCHLYGPGAYPHRTRLERPIADPLPKGHDMIYGIVVEPGAWGDAPGDVSGIVIRNVTIDDTWAPVAYSMGENNNCHDLLMENVTATHIRGIAQPINRQDCVKSWDTMTFRNVTVSK